MQKSVKKSSGFKDFLKQRNFKKNINVENNNIVHVPYPKFGSIIRNNLPLGKTYFGTSGVINCLGLIIVYNNYILTLHIPPPMHNMHDHDRTLRIIYDSYSVFYGTPIRFYACAPAGNFTYENMLIIANRLGGWPESIELNQQNQTIYISIDNATIDWSITNELGFTDNTVHCLYSGDIIEDI
jgi:hypothetical protein